MIQKRLPELLMPKNILIDLNVIIDVLLERQGYESSLSVLLLNTEDNYKLFVSAHIVPTFAYLLENAKVPPKEILRQINWLVHTFSVVEVNSNLLKKALKSKITDYEDAVTEQAALVCSATSIITRNTKDFKNSLIKAITPENFIQNLN